MGDNTSVSTESRIQARPFLVVVIVVGILVIFCLAATFFSLQNTKPYQKFDQISTLPTTYEEYLDLALSAAKEWDPNYGLVSLSGAVNCAQTEQPVETMSFSIATSKFYFGFPRTIFGRVTINPEQELLKIVAEPSELFGRPATHDVSLMNITLYDAIAIAQEEGGSDFVSNYPDCSIVFLMRDYVWHLQFDPSLTDYNDNALLFDIDSRTGEISQVLEE